MAVLTLFLSGGKSLRAWQRDGILSREILLYRELLKKGVFARIRVFSYDAADRAFVREMAENEAFYRQIDILAPPRGRGGAAWGLIGVMRYRHALKDSAVLKTNQVSGAWAALLASWVTGRPLIFRLGYLLSRRFALNGQGMKRRVAALIERLAAFRAARIVVTSGDSARHFQAHPRWADKVALLPTYVDTSVFVPADGFDPRGSAITVARLRPQKNLGELLRGCAEAGCALTLVGQGELEAELKTLAAQLGLDVRWEPLLDNIALAALLREHGLFLLPSLHEGLPKALIEAMAAGLVCIGTPIPGITDLIRDGNTGYLTDGFDGAAIARAIRRVRSEADPDIGKRARALIEQRHGLDHYVEAEAAIYRGIGL